MTAPQDMAAMVDEAAAGFARLSPAARRFMAGDMSDDEALRLGFRRPPPDDVQG
ncbi:MAG TPA: hypothetical protein VFI47_06590 [Acidimicrobiales bacterium]|nr:hypothetical protein [Acidimicrobiales bacterium]